MIFDMNIRLEGIDEVFLEELEELIEDTRVEYFVINPVNEDELMRAREICAASRRFRYTLPVAFRELGDDNALALRVSGTDEIGLIGDMPAVIHADDIDDTMIEELNAANVRGVVLEARESDNRLHNFIYAISHDSLKDWSKKGITDTDYNKIAIQSDYPDHSYDDLLDILLKDISDLTFRAEQTIAAGGTRSLLRTFGLL